MKCATTLLLAAGAGVASAQPANTQLCSWDGSGQVTPNPAPAGAISFSACGITNPTAMYVYKDPTDISTYNSTYYFNIGNNVAIDVTVQPACANTGVAPVALPAAAYQYINSGTYAGSCFALTSDVTLPRPIIAAQFFDQKNPARGWQITYPIGPGTLTCKTGRSFTYVFMCDRTTPAPPTTSGNYTFIDEISSCNYAAFMYSQVGCPTQCPRTAKGVCNNQGICGFDKAANTAKCYCNSGYNVADCSVTSRAPSGGAIFGALSGGSVLGALCVVAYSFFRLRKTAPAGAPGGDGFYASG